MHLSLSAKLGRLSISLFSGILTFTDDGITYALTFDDGGTETALTL